MTQADKINGIEPGADSRDMIRGLKVEQRTPAMAFTPADRTKKVAINGVDEVLLADGSVLYQCTRSKFCFQAFGEVTQAIPHLRSHGGQQAAARQDAEIERNQARQSVFSKAGKRAQEVRHQRVALLLGDEGRAAWLAELASTLEEALPVLRELSRLKVEVAGPPVTDEELAVLRDKAAKWDGVRGLLNS